MRLLQNDVEEHGCETHSRQGYQERRRGEPHTAQSNLTSSKRSSIPHIDECGSASRDHEVILAKIKPRMVIMRNAVAKGQRHVCFGYVDLSTYEPSEVGEASGRKPLLVLVRVWLMYNLLDEDAQRLRKMHSRLGRGSGDGR